MSGVQDKEEEARPGPAETAEQTQPQAPAPRKAPVRFEDPVEKPPERIVENRPVFYRDYRQEREQRQSSSGAARYQSFYEEVDERAEGRASTSSILGEIDRERHSPTPITEERRVHEDDSLEETRERVRQYSRDESPPAPLRERLRTFSGDSDEPDIRIRRDRQPYYEAGRPRDHSPAPSPYSPGGYVPRPRFIDNRQRSRYDDEEEIDIRMPSRQRSSERRKGSSYYDDDDGLDIRVRRPVPPSPRPVVYPEYYSRPLSRPEYRGASSYYDDDDELDIRVRRGYSPSPVVYPAHRSRSRSTPRRNYEGSSSYLVPAPSRDRMDDYELERRKELEMIRIEERAREEYALERKRRELEELKNAAPREDYELERTRRELEAYRRARELEEEIEKTANADDAYGSTVRSRSRSRPSPAPAQAPSPVIINNRIYNDYEDDDYMALTPHRSRSRSRSRSAAPGRYEPVIINTAITNDREYSDDGDSQYLSREHRALALNRRLQGADLDAVTQAYSFSLSRHSKNSESSRSISGSVSEISEQSEPTQEEPLKLPTSSGRTHNILRSHYVGNGLVTERHAVELTVTPESDPSKRKSIAPIFRWMSGYLVSPMILTQMLTVFRHFEDMNMDLEQFQSNALSISHLEDSERSAISKLIDRAKRKYDKPLQTSRNMKTKFMVPSFLQDNISGEKRPKASRARTISWLCVPYFRLARYATPSSLKPSSHPMRTLLQARYSLVQRKRDMEQAVCQVTGTPEEHCFYIAQIWLLILDDSLIVSCAQLPMSLLQGESIKIIDNPTDSSTTLSQNILIYTKNSLLWCLPANECQDWFAFVSHFWEYWPRPFQITHHDKAVTSENWHKVFLIAKKTGLRLSIDFRPSIKEPAKGILLEDPISEEGSTKGATDASSETSDSRPASRPSLRVKDHRRSKPDISPLATKEEFHIFTWSTLTDETRNASHNPPAVNISKDSPFVETSKPEDDQKEIDDFLRLKTNLNDRLAYRACPLSKRIELYKVLAKERTELSAGTGTEQPDQYRRKRYETKVDILNAADSILQFFLPSDSQSMTTQKFWGALLRLWESAVPRSEMLGNVSSPLPDIYPHKGDRDCQDLVEWLQMINRSITPFRDLMSQVPAADRANIQIPEELERAWLHLLLSFAFLVWEDMQVFDDQMVICNDLLELGMKTVIRNMSDVRLSDYAVFPPSEFASLVTFQLLHDVKDSALDISETYLEYLKLLESDIESNPLDRGHQNRIVSLKQEIAVISETLSQQQRVLSQAQVGFGYSRVATHAEFEPDSLEARRSRSHAPVYYTSREQQYKGPSYVENEALPRPMQTNDAAGQNIDPSGVQGLLLQDGLAVVEKRIREFREMRDRASDLGDWNIQKIDSNKDRQEAAIYAFTIVTIIFLPLSTVASILGMNTFDVRNMNVNQWVFWATALPLMVVIITLCLIWAGELKNFWEGFAKLWSGGSGKRYLALDDGLDRRERYFDTIRERNHDRSGLARRHALYGGKKESYDVDF